MKTDVIVAEIGSTTTLVNAFSNVTGMTPVFVGQGQAPTSVLDGDVRVGLSAAMDDFHRKNNGALFEGAEMFATSSAAGGLRMTVHGLIYDMTAKAAKEAALGAGAIVRQVTAGPLRQGDIERLMRISPNIIMIAGGVDHGERDTAIANAERIRELGLDIPVVYAGNVDAQDEIRGIFAGASAPLYVVDNVYPKIDELNVEPARRAIQAVFEEHIVRAPGMEYVRDMVSGPIMPTPGAVMEAAKLLYGEMGDLMIADVGGATTDIHSVTEGSEEISRILVSPEPTAKRTVEGDLGVYVNMRNLIEMIGEERLSADLGFDIGEVVESYKFVPVGENETRFVERLTLEAVTRATERHAGRIRYIYGPSGRTTLAEGKDLSRVKYIIGTGGALTRLPSRVEILSTVPLSDKTGLALIPPQNAEILIDNDYIMASLGALSKIYPETALRLLRKSFGMTA
jgi:uncharacterized protein (TIGR01319 family)